MIGLSNPKFRDRLARLSRLSYIVVAFAVAFVALTLAGVGFGFVFNFTHSAPFGLYKEIADPANAPHTPAPYVFFCPDVRWSGMKGELRRVDAGSRPASDVATSLNDVFDRLARENHLKGRSPEEWSHSLSAYIYELGTIQPFLTGNEVALREFADELARKNNLSLQWDVSPEIGTSDTMRHLDQSKQSANIRRVVMLAIDTCPSSLRPSRGAVAERGIETLFSAGPLP
jgi:hypothetical protein